MKRKQYKNTEWNTIMSSAGFSLSSGVPLRSDDSVFQVNCPRRSTSLPTGGALKTSHSRKQQCCAAARGSMGSSCTSVAPDVPLWGHGGNGPYLLSVSKAFSLIMFDKLLSFLLNTFYLLLPFNNLPSLPRQSLKIEAISLAFNWYIHEVF